MELIIYSLLLILLGVFAITFGLPFFHGAPYVPTDKKGVEVMVRLAKPGRGDKALDIGSGDGRLVIALAREGALADGIEINPLLVVWSRAKIKKVGMANTAHILKQDLWKTDLSQYNIISVFGIAYIMEKLAKKIERESRPGTRIVSNRFSLPGWTPVAKENNIYLYIKE